MQASMMEVTADSVGTDLAQAKRFVEYVRADPARAQRATEDSGAVARELGLTIDPDQFRRLWDLAYAQREKQAEATTLEQEYRDYARGLLDLRDRMRKEARSRDDRLGAWRDRQVRRAALELGDGKSAQIVHAPFAIELSRGCSVGCWFCGVSAPKLSDVFAYTKENAALWRGVLTELTHVFGDATRWGFCYWASDPLDNPDYERFCVDLHEITGGFPQTTTAIPLRDPDRVRHLLRLSEEMDGPVNRFSVLTTKILDRIHHEFTPDELMQVELIPQNRESSLLYADAGRARAKRTGNPTKDEAPDAVGSGTIACVSGFLINMVDRSIKLISPSRADDQWPDGYVVLAEDRFDDGLSLHRTIDRMLDARPQSAAELGSLRFGRRLSYERTAEGFVLRSGRVESRREHPQAGAWLGEIGDAIDRGRLTRDGIALEMALRFGTPEDQTTAAIDTMFDNGLFDEEPT